MNAKHISTETLELLRTLANAQEQFLRAAMDHCDNPTDATFAMQIACALAYCDAMEAVKPKLQASIKRDAKTEAELFELNKMFGGVQ